MVIGIAVVACAVIILLNTYIFGFTINEEKINIYLTDQLKEEQGHIEFIQLQNIVQGNTESRIYEYTCDSGEKGYLAIALLKNIFLYKYKVTDMFLLQDKEDDKYSGILLSEGYIKTYVYTINDKTLYTTGEFSKISWGGPIVCGVLVFILGRTRRC